MATLSIKLVHHMIGNVEIHGPFSVPEPDLLLFIGHLLLFVFLGLGVSVSIDDDILNEESRIRVGIVAGLVCFALVRSMPSVIRAVDIFIILLMFLVPIILTAISIQLLVETSV